MAAAPDRQAAKAPASTEACVVCAPPALLLQSVEGDAYLKELRAQAATRRVLRPDPPTPVGQPAPKRLSAAVNAGIAADYEAGVGVREIARKYGINERTAHIRLKRAGVTKRPNKLTDEQIERILALHADGLSNAETARRVGVSEGSVHNVLKRNLSA